MHFGNDFEANVRLCPMPPAVASAQSIPPFFVDFLHRFHRLLNEYSAELSRWSGGMRFCAPQRTLYGRKFAATPPSVAKGRPKVTTRGTQRAKNAPRERNGRHQQQTAEGHCHVRIIPLMNKQEHDGGPQQHQPERTLSVLQPAEGNSQEIQGQTFPVFDDPQPNVSSPNSVEQRTYPSRRRVAVHPPLSIRDRLRRTLAPENLAIAANEQIPLETLEQTVTETLPESITESENYVDFLRQYLDAFEHDLENDDELNMFCAEKTNEGPGEEGPLTQTDDATVHCVDVDHAYGDDPISAADFVGAPHDKQRKFAQREDGAVQPVTIKGGRKRSSSSSSVPQFRWKVFKECENGQRNDGDAEENAHRTGTIGAERRERWVVIDTEAESNTSATASGDEEGEEGCNGTFGYGESLLQSTKQYGASDRTPQKSVGESGFPCTALSSSCAASSSPISSLFPISTVKVLERGRVKFNTTPPTDQMTPTKSSSGSGSASSAADDHRLMATPKLLSTRRVYCNLMNRRRPGQIAPQKEGGKRGEKRKIRGEEQLGEGEEEEDGGQRRHEEGKGTHGSADEREEEEERHGEEDGVGEGWGQETANGGGVTTSKRRSMEQNAAKSGITCGGIGPTATDGKFPFLELDDELIGLVLNEIHAAIPDDNDR